MRSYAIGIHETCFVLAEKRAEGAVVLQEADLTENGDAILAVKVTEKDSIEVGITFPTRWSGTIISPSEPGRNLAQEACPRCWIDPSGKDCIDHR